MFRLYLETKCSIFDLIHHLHPVIPPVLLQWKHFSSIAFVQFMLQDSSLQYMHRDIYLHFLYSTNFPPGIDGRATWVGSVVSISCSCCKGLEDGNWTIALGAAVLISWTFPREVWYSGPVRTLTLTPPSWAFVLTLVKAPVGLCLVRTVNTHGNDDDVDSDISKRSRLTELDVTIVQCYERENVNVGKGCPLSIFAFDGNQWSDLNIDGE